MKTTYSKMAGQNVRNNWGAVAVSLTVAACTSLVLFSRWSPKIEQRIDADQPRNGDGICEQSEAYPRKMGANRQFTNERNPYYSKLDCHDGDGVYDDSTDVRDMDGNKVVLPLAYPDGKPVKLPLEGVDSIDYRLKMIREQPSIPGALGTDAKKINRPLVSAKPGEMVIRPEAEWEQIVRDPTGLPESIFDPTSGNNSFKRPWLLKETCNRNPSIPDCAPNVNQECFSANHEKCPPREKAPETKAKSQRVPASPKCGNWKVEEGEDCDPPGSACRGDDGQERKCDNHCFCEVNKVSVADCEKVDNARRQKAIAQVLNRAGAIRPLIDQTHPDLRGKVLAIEFTGKLGGQNGGDVDLVSISVEGLDIKALMENKMKSAHVANGIPCGFSYHEGKLEPKPEPK